MYINGKTFLQGIAELCRLITITYKDCLQVLYYKLALLLFNCILQILLQCLFTDRCLALDSLTILLFITDMVATLNCFLPPLLNFS